jgi:polyhydroxyalkanoate synthesis regulator phasin
MFPQKQNQGFPDFQGLSELMNTLVGKGPISDMIAGVVTGAELADYVLRKADQYEKDQRYDDNLNKVVRQASRLYESGQITKEQFKNIIDNLPETVETKMKTVEVETSNQNDLNEMLKNVDPTKLAQLLKMIQ